MKKFILSITFILSAIGLSGQQTADRLMEAKALDAGGKSDQAVRVLSDAIALKPDSRLYIARAEARLRQKSVAEAIADYNEANSMDPGSGEYGLARAYSLKGDVSTSLYHLSLSMGSKAKRPEKEIMLDPALSILENKPEWRQFWKKEWYTGAEKSLSEIEYYASRGKAEDARTVLNELKGNYPGSEEAAYGEAVTSLSEGKYSEAVKAVTGLLNSGPDNEKYLLLLARAQAANGNPAGASDSYSKLLSLGSSDAGILIQRAECYRKTGESDKAMKDVERYLQLYPDDKTANSMAAKIETGSGDNLKALEYYSKNLKLHPNDAECYIERGNTYFMSKSWDWAINDYSMSLDLSPSNSDIWLKKGMALLSTGRTEDACHDFKKALTLGNKKASELISTNCIK
jgi:tetratricopeptide (TPR) repeat protein